jgi:hypothetical protein
VAEIVAYEPMSYAAAGGSRDGPEKAARVKRFLARSLLIGVFALWPGAAGADPILVPPPGWIPRDAGTSSPGIHVTGAWVSPVSRNGFPDTLNLTTESSTAGFADYMAASRAALLKAMTKTLTLDADETCGSATAHRFQFETPFGTNVLSITQLLRLTPTKAYIATYVHMVQNPEDPVALAALRTMCKDDAGAPPPNA